VVYRKPLQANSVEKLENSLADRAGRKIDLSDRSRIDDELNRLKPANGGLN
jgi:hypothetical protein